VNSPNASTASSMKSDDARQLAMALSVSRIIAAPIVGGLILFAAFNAQSETPSAGLQSAARFVALGVFVLAALTDVLDGWIARKYNATTPLGAAIDHIADKALTSATLIACAATLWAPLMALVALLLVLRDVVIVGLREGLALSGRRLPVDQGGKWKTAFLMLGLFAALLDAALLGWPKSGIADAVYLGSHALLVIALALSLWTGVLYVRRAMRREAAAGEKL
jgi:CDP-diacylglycerol--glycerol-3-phosphate 3-phosphatidyltransferase